MAFLSPILLSALALASIPIVIHLLNRKRFIRIDWAPMEHLKLTLRNNRRRLRLEQWLLLALRTLAVAAVILAIARPIIRPQGAVTAALASRARTGRILVLDDSLSMGYRDGGRAAFESALSAAGRAVDQAGSQDLLTIVACSDLAHPLAREADAKAARAALAALSATEPTGTRSDWAGTLRALDELLERSALPLRHVTLFTDLRRTGWDQAVSPITQRWAGQGVEVTIVDVGARTTDNVALLSLRMEQPVALPHEPVRLMATIRNDADRPAPAGQATLVIDGQARPVTLPELPSRRAVHVPLTTTFDNPGSKAVRLSLPPDALAGDNQRDLVIEVRPSLAMTVVDGEPGARPFEGETDFLIAALTVGHDSWRWTRTTDPELRDDEGAGKPDVIVLANVPSLSQAQAAALQRRVEDGAGLLVFVGDQVDLASYNERLFNEGRGLLPARLERIIDEPLTGLAIDAADDSPLDALRRLAPAALARLRVNKVMAVTPASGAGLAVPGNSSTGDMTMSATRSSDSPETLPGAGGASSGAARVLARWNDAMSTPAAIERRVGKGRVMLWTVTADRAWSDWPVDPTYVLAMRSSIASIVAPAGLDRNLTVGQPIELSIAQPESVANPRLVPPSATSAGATIEEAIAVEAKRTPGLPTIMRHADTRRAGLYRFAWSDAGTTPRQALVALNPDSSESELSSIAPDELKSLMAPLQPSIVAGVTSGQDASETPREMWRTLIAAVIILLIVETALAVWVGRER